MFFMTLHIYIQHDLQQTELKINTSYTYTYIYAAEAS
jgi:hypothetical protein